MFVHAVSTWRPAYDELPEASSIQRYYIGQIKTLVVSFCTAAPLLRLSKIDAVFLSFPARSSLLRGLSSDAGKVCSLPCQLFVQDPDPDRLLTAAGPGISLSNLICDYRTDQAPSEGPKRRFLVSRNDAGVIISGCIRQGWLSFLLDRLPSGSRGDHPWCRDLPSLTFHTPSP